MGHSVHYTNPDLTSSGTSMYFHIIHCIWICASCVVQRMCVQPGEEKNEGHMTIFQGGFDYVYK